MKIALLARNPSLYSHRRICEAARARGHEIEVINTLRVSINITSRKPTLYYRRRQLEGFDAVIPRIGASVTFYGLAVLRQFEVMGIYPLNESVAIGRSRDKLRCMQLLARRGIGLPVTAYTHDPRQAEDIIDLVGGAPVIIKLLEGTQGIGVVLGDTMKSAKSVIEAFQGANVDILVQEFIKESELDRHPCARHRREGGGGNEAPGTTRRIPLQFASRRVGGKSAHHPAGAERSGWSSAYARPQCLRRRHAALEKRTAGARG